MAKVQRKPTRGKRGKGRFIPKRKVCLFCADKSQVIDYKNVPLLNRFISDRGRIEPRRKTGVCPKHQRSLSVALKRARFIALLPYTAEHVRQSGGIFHRDQARYNSRSKPAEHITNETTAK